MNREREREKKMFVFFLFCFFCERAKQTIKKEHTLTHI